MPGQVKGRAWALHPDAIWIEGLKGIPRSSSSALLFTKIGAKRPQDQVCGRKSSDPAVCLCGLILHLEVKLANEVAEWLQIGPSCGGKPQRLSPETAHCCGRGRKVGPSFQLQGEGIC